MLIGEVVLKTGLSRDSIRFYEKRGLIKLNRKDRRDNNYKEYSDAILHELTAIKDLKGYGFTLNEIKEILSLWQEDLLNCEDGKEKVLEKISVIEMKIEQLKEIKNQLKNSIVNCPQNCGIKEALKNVSHI